MKIKQIDFNWRQEGSVQDTNGAGENGNYIKIFDPNFVEYVNE